MRAKSKTRLASCYGALERHGVEDGLAATLSMGSGFRGNGGGIFDGGGSGYGEGSNGGDGHRHGGGGGAYELNHGHESTDLYYQKMIEANPGNALLLGDYAKFLKEVSVKTIFGKFKEIPQLQLFYFTFYFGFDIVIVTPQNRGGPLTTRQPAEYSWMSGYLTPLTKIGQSLLCTGSSTQGTTCPNNQQ